MTYADHEESLTRKSWPIFNDVLEKKSLTGTSFLFVQLYDATFF